MTLSELQTWVDEDWKQRSAHQPDVQLQLIYLFEELGEMAEAIRKQDGNKNRKDVQTDLAGEMADVLISLITLANYHEIDLTEAIKCTQAKITARHSQGN